MMYDFFPFNRNQQNFCDGIIFLQKIVLLISLKSAPHMTCSIYKPMPRMSWFNNRKARYLT